MPKTEAQYLEQVKDYLNDFDFEIETQQLAIVAIKELLEDGKTWQWIAVALGRKSPREWEIHGFGLMWNKRFIEDVNKAIKRKKDARNINVNDFWNEKTADCF